MTDKDLKRLRRDELLEMLIAQSKKMEQLQEELDAARAALESRDIMLQEAGSIAEAAIRINGVFEAAQAAAQQYLENVRRISGAPPQAPGDKLPEKKEAPEQNSPEKESSAPSQNTQTVRKDKIRENRRKKKR